MYGCRGRILLFFKQNIASIAFSPLYMEKTWVLVDPYLSTSPDFINFNTTTAAWLLIVLWFQVLLLQ